jgi:hypothetical protein
MVYEEVSLMFNPTTIERIFNAEIETEPFNHIVIDDFFTEDFATGLELEFPDYEDSRLYRYDNPIEVKRAMNLWDKFPKLTYNAFWFLCSPQFSDLLSKKIGSDVYADYGLNGGGWHMHGNKGKLNIHQDYSIHPKIPFERKLNIIIYLSKDWNPEWGGGLEFWSHDAEKNKAKEMVKRIDVKFNRAVIFDTTQNSWHGLPGTINCPDDVYRKSLAVYYVQKPNEGTMQNRSKAWYMPTEEQQNDQSVLDFIEVRKQTLPGAV